MNRDGAPTFDLQSHSNHSDGALEPAEVVAMAAQAGVELLALTDHDSVEGIAEADRAARSLDLRVIPAVEISSIDQAGSDLHILGYLIDHEQALLRERLEFFRSDRERRADRIVEAIRELGFDVDEALLADRVSRGQSVGRPHLAEAVVRHPANAARLEAEGRLEPSAFLEAYLIEGRPAFRSRQSPTVRESIDAIHEAGGLAVWAHPFWDVPDPVDVIATIDRFRGLGIDGVECFYPTHGAEQTALLVDRCAELSLLTTGSSDFHGPEHRLFDRFRAFSTYGREPVLGPIGA